MVQQDKFEKAYEEAMKVNEFLSSKEDEPTLYFMLLGLYYSLLVRVNLLKVVDAPNFSDASLEARF